MEIGWKSAATKGDILGTFIERWNFPYLFIPGKQIVHVYDNHEKICMFSQKPVHKLLQSL